MMPRMTDHRPWFASYPPDVPKTLEPYPEESAFAMLDGSARRFPDHVAIAWFGAHLTYRQLLDEVERCSAMLAGMGVAKGDRVALITPNSPHYTIAYYATVRLGAVITGCNPLYTKREMEHQLRDSGAKVVIVADLMYSDYAEVFSTLGLEHVVVDGGGVGQRRVDHHLEHSGVAKAFQGLGCRRPESDLRIPERPPTRVLTSIGKALRSSLLEATQRTGFETGWGDVFGDCRALLEVTERVAVATGILNLWMHEPAEVAEGHAELTTDHPGRFLLGIGVSHSALIDSTEGGRYEKPMERTRHYLDALDSASPPVPVDERALAALR